MSHDEHARNLSGRLQQLLFSPKGGIEGMLMTVGAETVQVSMRHDEADPRELQKACGKAIVVTASADHSPKAREGAHAVYKLHAIKKLGGKAARSNKDAHAIRGVVAALHYAKHGEPNGVILESGEFIHTRPPGMKKLKLEIGSKVVAQGEVRMTVLGTLLMEADRVNRVPLA